jgi:hypothetical protein
MLSRYFGLAKLKMRVGMLFWTPLEGVPREPMMLKGHLPRVIYHQVYKCTKRNQGFTHRKRSGPGKGAAGIVAALGSGDAKLEKVTSPST